MPVHPDRRPRPAPRQVTPVAYESEDEGQSRFNREVLSSLVRTQQNPLLGGIVLEDVAVSASPVRVPHLLGRAPVGFLVIGQTANVVVWNSAAANDVALTLTASATATVDILVF